MPEKLRIGVIGCGTYGTHILKCLSAEARRDRIVLAALADPDEKTRAGAAERFGLAAFESAEAMIANTSLDAVAIATPDHLHHEPITSALANGLHVMTEKPLDVRSQRAEQLVEQFREAGLVLYVDMHKRFDPAHIRLRQDIISGHLGRLHHAAIHMEDRIEVPKLWLKNWASQSSPSWFLGINFYDLIGWLTDLEPVEVWATGQKGVLHQAGLPDLWDSIQAHVRYENGFTAAYGFSWILPDCFPSIVNQGLRMIGSEGIAEIDSQDRGSFAAYGSQNRSAVSNPFSTLEYDHPLHGPVTEGYTFEAIRHFIDVVNAHRAGQDVEGRYPGGQSVIGCIKLAEAVDRSLDAGGVVAV